MNKKTTALTTEQYENIITSMREGSSFFRPNDRVATALVLEGNLGLRISDIVKLRPCDIVNDGGRFRLSIVPFVTICWITTVSAFWPCRKSRAFIC